MLTQAGQDVFHPEVVPGLLGGEIGRPQAKVLGVRKKAPKRFNICGMFPIFFLPSVTEGRNSFQRDFF